MCYELNDLMVWGKIVGGITHYDIRIDSYQVEHDDLVVGDWKEGLAPSTECAYFSQGYKGTYWDTKFVRHDLCEPVGHKGGN